MQNDIKTAMWRIFKSYKEEAITMNHYDFAEETDYSEDQWLDFLSETDVKEYIDKQLKVIQQAELSKMIKDIGSSNSVGQAQLMNALQKLNENKTIKKEGPTFIYTYVPLTDAQKEADNIKEEEIDPFLRR